ncbi:hypothetical protein DFH11DRAFT_1625521 [Phellopilus nigrolimitatus]|nr:hypothetical protein DFH11DRAFT_1625521 [Phellopilus nigrolimitatus]
MSTPTGQADSSALQGSANRNAFLHLQAVGLELRKPAKRPLSIEIFVNDDKESRSKFQNDKPGNPSQWKPNIYFEAKDSLRFVITKKYKIHKNKTYKIPYEAETVISYLSEQDPSLSHGNASLCPVFVFIPILFSVFRVLFDQGSLTLDISLPDSENTVSLEMLRRAAGDLEQQNPLLAKLAEIDGIVRTILEVGGALSELSTPAKIVISIVGILYKVCSFYHYL